MTTSTTGKAPTFMMAAPQAVLDCLDKEAASEGLTRQRMLLKIACERYGLPFVAETRGRAKKPPEPVYKCKTVAEAVQKAVEVEKAVTAKIGGKLFRVWRSGMMKALD